MSEDDDRFHDDERQPETRLTDCESCGALFETSGKEEAATRECPASFQPDERCCPPCSLVGGALPHSPCCGEQLKGEETDDDGRTSTWTLRCTKCDATFGTSPIQHLLLGAAAEELVRMYVGFAPAAHWTNEARLRDLAGRLIAKARDLQMIPRGKTLRARWDASSVRPAFPGAACDFCGQVGDVIFKDDHYRCAAHGKAVCP